MRVQVPDPIMKEDERQYQQKMIQACVTDCGQQVCSSSRGVLPHLPHQSSGAPSANVSQEPTNNITGFRICLSTSVVFGSGQIETARQVG